MHSTRSDGACSPEQVLEFCAAGGLDVISLTDHDLSTELAPGRHTLGKRDITVIAGAEMSGVLDGEEHHLLVYFPGCIPDSFRAFCIERVQERANRYESAVGSIGLPGLPEPCDRAREGERALTRHHLARALVDAGHAADVRDAFKRFAAHSHGHVPTVTLPFVDAIRLAREAGGVTSWAHPRFNALEAHLPKLVEAGLQGLEGIRPGMNSAERRKVRKMAQRHGLFLTGGSDWHGWRDERLGLFSVSRPELAGFLAALDYAAA
jgi:predicted metal-dependent phosphoesterase TrpH